MTFKVTDKAFEEIKNVIETRSNKESIGVRVYIKGIG
jgi:Fe-S cluster assembly iron-binding protein IscA